MKTHIIYLIYYTLFTPPAIKNTQSLYPTSYPPAIKNTQSLYPIMQYENFNF
ncbi:hypothetical protein HanRHA438_Chr10g0462171 [Helianthus annuus]|nr:hypothetical protein HanRHA438_Chr10g0462171 [Helianthus annuus]